MMNKQEFLNALSDRLQGIPIDDREKSLEYYSEMIDDMQEDGLTEEQAVKAMGSINEIADKIINDMPIEKILKTKVTPKNSQKKIECIGNHFDCSRLSDMVSHSNFIDCGNIYIISGIVGTDTLHLYRSIFVCGVGHSNYYCTCYEHS